mmetsp:Transcript_67655/g.209187  ORF Transcript_67655/g.209187 Transcript_67655/m.209187 type:complete len:267 (+) Transcript_67655:509-1309(+)
MRILHELLAETPRIRAHGGAEHHHLLLLRRLHEDLLHVLPHVELVQALVALVQHKLRQLVELQVLVAQEAEHAAGGADQDVGATVPEHLAVPRDGYAAVHDARLHVLEVLGKAVELVLDLVGQLPRVADDQRPDGLLRGIQLLQTGEHEDGRLAHAGLGLAKHVRAQNGLRDALVLDLRRVLETAIYDGSQQLGLEEEVAETRGVDGGVAALLAVRAGLLRLLLAVLLLLGVLLLVEVRELLLHTGHGFSGRLLRVGRSWARTLWA